MNGHSINSSLKEFKRLFGVVGRQKFKKVEWLGSQAEIKAFFDLLKTNKLIDNQNINQLVEQCFYSLKNSLTARILGAVTSQNKYILLAKDQDESHIIKLAKVKRP